MCMSNKELGYFLFLASEKVACMPSLRFTFSNNKKLFELSAMVVWRDSFLSVVCNARGPLDDASQFTTASFVLFSQKIFVLFHSDIKLMLFCCVFLSTEGTRLFLLWSRIAWLQHIYTDTWLHRRPGPLCSFPPPQPYPLFSPLFHSVYSLV